MKYILQQPEVWVHILSKYGFQQVNPADRLGLHSSIQAGSR